MYACTCAIRMRTYARARICRSITGYSGSAADR